jgi:sister-chromatid-cohesion protein PDS5
MTEEAQPVHVDQKMLKASYISTTNLSETELINRLTKLADLLSQVEQKEKQKEKEENTPNLDEIAAALVQQSILKHKNNEVRLLAACCLADIFRIYAPNPPYDDTQLENIFKLFLAQLKALENIKAVTSKRLVYLLERLALVKAFVLVLENEKLVVKLFQLFFSIIGPDHSNFIIIYMLDILISCIEENDNITQSLLDVILGNLLQDENKSAKVMAQHIIQRCAEKLQPAVTKFLSECIVEGRSESELKERSHEIIYELYFLQPNLLLYVLPQLENELKVETLETRSTAVQLLARIFAAKDNQTALNYHQLYNAFLGRFKDINPDIRIVMCEFAQHFLQNHTDPKLLQPVETLLEERLHDPEERVRLAAVGAICNVCQCTTGRISEKTLRQVAQRMRDRKPQVRDAAMRGLSQVYRYQLAQAGSENLPKTYQWIPSQIMHIYLLPDAEDKIRVEEIFDEVLMFVEEEKSTATSLDKPLKTGGVDKKKAAKTASESLAIRRAQRLLQIVTTFDATSRNTFRSMLKDKHAFISDFRIYLQLRNGKDDANLHRVMQTLASRLPGNSLEKFRKVHDYNDEIVNRHLQILVDPNTNAQQRQQAKEAIWSRINQPKKAKKGEKTANKKNTYWKYLLRKLSINFIGPDEVAVLFEQCETKNKESIQQVLNLLEDIADTFAQFFASSLENLIGLLNKKKEIGDEGIERVLHILVSVYSYYQKLGTETPLDVDSNVQKRLMNLCVNGTPAQAKYSIRMLSRVTSSKVVYNKLVKDLMNEIEANRNLVTVFNAFLELSRHIKLTSEFLKVYKFICEDLLPRAWSDTTDSNAELPSNDCAERAAGIKFISKYLTQESDEEEKGRTFLDLLFKIIERDGECCTEGGANEVDKATLRLASATAILKLGRQKRYEQYITPSRFQQLALFSSDRSVMVREGFARQLFKGLKEIQRLPLKYLCFLFLYASEEKKDLLATIRKWIIALIQIRRKYFRENRERLLKESEQKDKEENIRPSQELKSLRVRSHYVKVIMGLLPEYCTPYFIHLLAHHPYFVNDAPKYLQSVRYLTFYLEHLTQGGRDNRNLIRQILIDIKQTRDALAPDSHNIHILAEIAYRLLVEHYPIPATTTQYSSSAPADAVFQEAETNTYLPESLYTLGEENTLLPLKEYLPGWQLPSTSRIAQLLSETSSSGSLPTSPEKGLRKSKEKGEEADGDEDKGSEEEEDKENHEHVLQELRADKTKSSAKKTPNKKSLNATSNEKNTKKTVSPKTRNESSQKATPGTKKPKSASKIQNSAESPQNIATPLKRKRQATQATVQASKEPEIVHKRKTRRVK